MVPAVGLGEKNDRLHKDGRSGRSGAGWAKSWPVHWRSGGGGVLTGLEGRLLFWQRAAVAVASGVGEEGASTPAEAPLGNLKLPRTLKTPPQSFTHTLSVCRGVYGLLVGFTEGVT